jgi:hypothetical protein
MPQLDTRLWDDASLKLSQPSQLSSFKQEDLAMLKVFAIGICDCQSIENQASLSRLSIVGAASTGLEQGLELVAKDPTGDRGLPIDESPSSPSLASGTSTLRSVPEAKSPQAGGRNEGPICCFSLRIITPIIYRLHHFFFST